MSEPFQPTKDQVEAARLRVVLDEKLGRPTPDWVRRIAEARVSIQSAEPVMQGPVESQHEFSVHPGDEVIVIVGPYSAEDTDAAQAHRSRVDWDEIAATALRFIEAESGSPEAAHPVAQEGKTRRYAIARPAITAKRRAELLRRWLAIELPKQDVESASGYMDPGSSEPSATERRKQE